MRPGDRAAAEVMIDLAEEKSNTSSDYEDIDKYDWFAHNFVYEGNLKEKKKKENDKLISISPADERFKETTSSWQSPLTWLWG